MKERKTNEELVADMMAFSKFGALAQLFVIEAIRRYAEQCVEADHIESTGLINGKSWKAVAIDIKRQMDEHLS